MLQITLTSSLAFRLLLPATDLPPRSSSPRTPSARKYGRRGAASPGSAQGSPVPDSKELDPEALFRVEVKVAWNRLAPSFPPLHALDRNSSVLSPCCLFAVHSACSLLLHSFLLHCIVAPRPIHTSRSCTHPFLPLFHSSLLLLVRLSLEESSRSIGRCSSSAIEHHLGDDARGALPVSALRKLRFLCCLFCLFSQQSCLVVAHLLAPLHMRSFGWLNVPLLVTACFKLARRNWTKKRVAETKRNTGHHYSNYTHALRR